MSENKIISGLDIGTTKICAIIGEYDPQKIFIKFSVWGRHLLLV